LTWRHVHRRETATVPEGEEKFASKRVGLENGREPLNGLTCPSVRLQEVTNKEFIDSPREPEMTRNKVN